LRARILPASPGSTPLAATIILEGGVVAVPTDTVYGLACDPRNSSAVDRLFEVKGREDKPIPVLCADLRSAKELVLLNRRALGLARRFWPGALTMVAPLRATLPVRLHQNSGWLGVRVPDSRQCIAIARAVGGAVTGTSANLSGRPSCRSAAEVLAELGDRIDAVVDGGRLQGRESTVVKILGDKVEVLRKGAVGVGSRGSGA
jgi:L-threonylcarbamoyladenylate synthase